MLNTFNGNTTRLNELAVNFGMADQDEFVFNGYSLQNEDIISSLMQDDSTPSREFETQRIQRANGKFATSDFWEEKIIRFAGIMRKSTNALLEAEIDKMKKALCVSESILDIKKAGTIRRYNATLINGSRMFEREGYHVTFCPFQLEFVCLTPFGQSVEYLAQSYLNKTDLSLSEEFYNEGTTKSLPIVTLNFSAASSVTGVTFTNDTTGEEISITETINAGDYLKFDSEEREVTLNGTIIDYDGAFPDLDNGSNLFTVTITGTSATYSLTVKGKKNYL